MIISVLVIIVNIITEVVKKTLELKDAKTINIFVTFTSILLSIVAYILTNTVDVKGIVASIIIGFMVAYAAMFGYDKLLSYFTEVIHDKRTGN